MKTLKSISLKEQNCCKQPCFKDMPRSSAKPFRDDEGKIVNDVYVVLSKAVGEEDLIEDGHTQNYLVYFKKLLVKAGYNIAIQKTAYKDSATGDIVKGSILIDRDEPEYSYHFIINGNLPAYEHGQNNPIALRKLKFGDHIKAIRHKKDIPRINSTEFTTEKLI